MYRQVNLRIRSETLANSNLKVVQHFYLSVKITLEAWSMRPRRNRHPDRKIARSPQERYWINQRPSNHDLRRHKSKILSFGINPLEIGLTWVRPDYELLHWNFRRDWLERSISGHECWGRVSKYHDSPDGIFCSPIETALAQHYESLRRHKRPFQIMD